MDTKSIKEKAKSLLEGRVLSIFVFIFIITSAASAISSLINAIQIPGLTFNFEVTDTTTSQIQQSSINLLAVIASLLITGPFAFAESNGMLKVARNKKASPDIIGEAKNAFSSDNMMRAIVANLRVDIFVALWTCVFFIPGIYKAIQYSQTMRILADNDKMSAAEAQKKSMEIMKGHTWDYIKLMLSFFGWYLLTAFTLGIASIYVSPYTELTKVEFYEKIKK